MTERERLNEQLTNLLQNYRHAGNTPGMKAIDASSQTMQLRGYPLDPKAFASGSPLTQAYRAMLAASPQASDETKAAKGE